MRASVSGASRSSERAFTRTSSAIPSAGTPSPSRRRIRSTIAAASAASEGKLASAGSGPSRPGRSKTLLGTAEPGDEAVGQSEDLRARAVVLLQPDDVRARKARRKLEQVEGGGAGEGIDRLVVVADDAELVPLPEPEVEQRLLEKVHVLVLVHRDRPALLAEPLDRRRLRLVEADEELEDVLEVDPPAPGSLRSS